MHLENHDMDDLFRMAGTHYPLKAADSDWEIIGRRLQQKSNEGMEAAGHNYGTSGFLVWLLLMPACFLLHNSIEKAAVPGVDTIQSYLAESPESDSPAKNSAPAETKVSRRQQPGSLAAGNMLATGSRERFAAGWSNADPIVASIVKYDRVIGTAKTDLIVPGNIDLPIPATNQINDRKKIPTAKPGFYLGAFAGLDWGTVKGQSLTKPGYNLGILAGYGFSRHWSFELGISWAQKNYFTHGAHFNMSKIESSMPGATMVAVEGQLMQVEIPYRIKYDFALRERSNFFFTAGGSANIYVKEANEYLTRVNGVQQLMKGTYKNIHCSPLCMVHLSAGYERKLKNQSRIRLEPYIKFPLRKMGMGSLPVLNAGLNVSITDFMGR